MVVRVGMIGMSEGNGHPFSFSAILNGYSAEDLARSGWGIIYDYLRVQDASAFGVDDLRVTHAWTQDPAVTRSLCDACLIPNPVERPEDLLSNVDAVILARDDFENHWAMAEPFLQAGMPVFVDKPLALTAPDIESFRPYLTQGKLMSCSGMRFARELDQTRASIESFGRIKLARGAAINGWEKYGVHVLEAILGIVPSRPVSVSGSVSQHESITIETDDGVVIHVDALGPGPKVFRVELFGTEGWASHDIADNFTMFRRMLWRFSQMIRNGEPAIPPDRTLDVMKVLIAGRMALESKRRIQLDDLPI